MVPHIGWKTALNTEATLPYAQPKEEQTIYN